MLFCGKSLEGGSLITGELEDLPNEACWFCTRFRSSLFPPRTEFLKKLVRLPVLQVSISLSVCLSKFAGSVVWTVNLLSIRLLCLCAAEGLGGRIFLWKSPLRNELISSPSRIRTGGSKRWKLGSSGSEPIVDLERLSDCLFRG